MEYLILQKYHDISHVVVFLKRNVCLVQTPRSFQYHRFLRNHGSALNFLEKKNLYTSRVLVCRVFVFIQKKSQHIFFCFLSHGILVLNPIYVENDS
jgi:hypothetical protein